jgi:RimJ/RimL family protein N-acetyltransferase
MIFNLLAFLAVSTAHNAMPDEKVLSADITFSSPMIDNRLTIYTDTVSTPHFFLMPMQPTHSRFLYPIYTDINTMAYYGFGKTYTIDAIDHKTRIKSQLNQMRPSTNFWLIVTHAGPCGHVSLTPADIYENFNELSFALAPEFTGKGIATKAAMAIMSQKGGNFCATVHPKNQKSIAVLKKLGFNTDPDNLNVSKYGSIRDYYTFYLSEQ